MGDKSKLKIGTYQNPNSGRSKESIDKYVRGMREKKYGGKRINTDRIRKFKTGMTPGGTDLEKAKEATKLIRDKKAQKRMKNSRPGKKGSSITDIFKSYGKYDGKPIELKGGGMSAGQAKLAAKAPPPNKIDAKDFAVLRAEKAKGRGMGLQDEKVQPGKVMKAKRGKLGEAKDYKKYLKGLKKATSEVRGAKLNSPAYNITTYDQKSYERAGGKGKAVFKDYKGLGIKNEDQYFKEKNASKFMKRRKELGAAGKALKATRIGKIALGVGAAGVAAQQYLKSKMKKKDEPKKKMGGGMMKRYSKGGGSDMSKEPTSKMKTSEKVRTYALAQSMKDKDRLTDRDIKKARELVKGKMGGGMMQKPMGYSKGVSVKARGCKLGRTRPTKIT